MKINEKSTRISANRIQAEQKSFQELFSQTRNQTKNHSQRMDIVWSAISEELAGQPKGFKTFITHTVWLSKHCCEVSHYERLQVLNFSCSAWGVRV